MKKYFVYILASGRNGTLYTGVTSDLTRRVQEHKDKVVEGFTKRYGVDKLVYYEMYDAPEEAIHREKNIKAWKRAWKVRTIVEANPTRRDLSYDLLQ